MGRAGLVALASTLLLALQSPGAAQHAASSPWASAAAPVMALPAAADTIRHREPRDRTPRLVTGTVVGGLLGASGGSIYGNRNYQPCEVDCFWDRGHEVLLFAILGGLGGGALGGLVGWFWPDQPAQDVGVVLAPTRRDGVAVSLSVRH